MVVVDEWEKEQPRGEIKKEYGGHREDEYTSYGFGRVALRGGEHFSFLLSEEKKIVLIHQYVR
jgi:hypothetical protein